MPEQLAGDPLAVLAHWLTEGEHHTMTFTTADADGTPHARTAPRIVRGRPFGARRHQRRSHHHDRGLGAKTAKSSRVRAETPIMGGTEDAARLIGARSTPASPAKPSGTARG
jgi:hypothetical protein